MIWCPNVAVLFDQFDKICTQSILNAFKKPFIMELLFKLTSERKTDLIESYAFMFKGLVTENIAQMEMAKDFLNKMIKIDPRLSNQCFSIKVCLSLCDSLALQKDFFFDERRREILQSLDPKTLKQQLWPVLEQ